ncbi:MAG: carboxypeptidase-like regulatory domain-containing protein, partial [Candidatus Angelobacter sp.]
MNSDSIQQYSYSFLRSLAAIFSIVIVFAVILALTAFPLAAQTATGALRGRVTDPSGAVIPGASITAIAADGKKTTTTTNHSGVYEIKSLPPGKYTVSAVAKGFAVDNEVDVNVAAGPAQSFDIALGIEVEQQQVTVQDEANTVGLSPTENSSAVVIKGKDLEALSDD